MLLPGSLASPSGRDFKMGTPLRLEIPLDDNHHHSGLEEVPAGNLPLSLLSMLSRLYTSCFCTPGSDCTLKRYHQHPAQPDCFQFDPAIVLYKLFVDISLEFQE